jgi:hypothetical protein
VRSGINDTYKEPCGSEARVHPGKDGPEGPGSDGSIDRQPCESEAFVLEVVQVNRAVARLCL